MPVSPKNAVSAVKSAVMHGGNLRNDIGQLMTGALRHPPTGYSPVSTHATIPSSTPMSNAWSRGRGDSVYVPGGSRTGGSGQWSRGGDLSLNATVGDSTAQAIRGTPPARGPRSREQLLAAARSGVGSGHPTSSLGIRDMVGKLAPLHVPPILPVTGAPNAGVAARAGSPSYTDITGAFISKPPPITMPRPSGLAYASVGMPPTAAQSEPWKNAAMWGAGIGAGIGYFKADEGAGFTGTSWSMMKGAMGGAVLAGGATHFGSGLISKGGKAIGSNKPLTGSWEPWNDTIAGGATKAADWMNTSTGRAAMIGGGGLLGGTFMGGYRNKRRGFNSNRGNRI